MRIITIVGARPQFIKAAPLSRALASRQDIEEVAVHTGQHYDQNMSDIFFEELAIARPKYNLGIHGGGHGEMTGRMLGKIEALLLEEKPAAVIVFGDTNTTLAGALAAAKLLIPVVHIEAGLRSFNRAMPEEVNRVLTDHVSALLMCPTRLAVSNLKNEGIRDGVHHTGDIMYDALRTLAPIAEKKSTVFERHAIQRNEYALATLHRAENTNTKTALRRARDYIANTALETLVVIPLHPRTKAALERFGVSFPEQVRVIEPVGYLDMLQLIKNATSVLTDSGGLQKEAYFCGVPCVTMRSETEWVETIENGWNRLWTTEAYRPRRKIDEYGDGDSASKIVDILRGYLLRL